MAKRDYLVDAAKQIRMALDREVSEDYEAAFNYYKNGVDLLLNGVQVDPNKERREAVKRKTTQYLKRAEEIFNSHLQGTLGDGTSLSGGYSSLRFRPIRNLSSPVEDLKMCKVIGVIDKVLTVQSLITKDTFVVKSLPKSSWESRDQPTIIPQGVPFMVKLLRYYVSEDTVYLHLEHVKGGRLFSKLRKSKNDRVKEHPECSSPTHGKIRLKNSYTSPSITQDYQRSGRGSREAEPLQEEGEGPRELVDSPDTDSPTSWDEAQRRLESCGTHSYCEETGCLHSARTRAPDLRTSWEFGPPESDGPLGVDPLHRTCPHSETQENRALPPQCHVAGGPRETPRYTWNTSARGVKSAESGSEFDIARKWESADPSGDCETFTHGVSTHTGSQTLGGMGEPETAWSFAGHTGSKAEPSLGINFHAVNSHTAPTMLHFTFSNQIRDCDPAAKDATADADRTTKGSHDKAAGLVLTMHQIRKEREQVRGENAEETKGKADDTRVAGRSQSTQALTPRTDAAESPSGTPTWNSKAPGIPLQCNADLSHRTSPNATGARAPAVPAARDGQAPLQCETEGPEPPDGPCLEQPIEVDGWCLLPRIPASRPTERVRLSCWGLPEGEVRLWAAQILLSIESLHQQGILCRDLNPRNILLDGNGKACLTYFGQWTEVQSEISTKAMEQMYCAPEVGGVSELTEACDWWSLGALLYELLTGMPLWQCHPAGVLPHTQLLIPDDLSTAAASLLTELLQFDAGYRLGSGGGGVSDIKCHPFFSAVPWHTLSS
ncbi:ribosomal protein S6 kinase-like 1 [Megalops cyprinoides]|uniref:ribosomal protein S6 kinase-like 1 n=1 Tax=Megalops cyprinoides TaxID=118141 RepID=UPI001864C690|nr:ribosomal protein S6 kinase-like 1 [Megalops cyprinoides]